MIFTQKQLKAFEEAVDQCEWVAVDTEADSLHAYPEKLCLLQVSVDGRDELIDTLAGLDLSSFLAVIKKRELILHGADYDLRLLHRAHRFVPERIFDTMWAARFLGWTDFGLRHLVEECLGAQLEKGPQKADWGRRPLTPRMEEYARNDTRYLKRLSDLLRERLNSLGRLSWLEEMGARVIEQSTESRSGDKEEAWRIKGSDRLPPAALNVLRELWLWREEEAVGANRPPFFVLNHDVMVQLAARSAAGDSVSDLIPARISGRRRSGILKAIARGQKAPEGEWPQRRRPVIPPRLTGAEAARFERIKNERDRAAKELELEASLIASRGLLVGLARGIVDLESGLMVWQRKLLKL